MLHTLENSRLKITAEDHGGELKSITSKIDGTEYLWNSDPTWWKYSAPVLFPIVGTVKNGEYRVGDQTFKLPQHGFARVSDFKCVDESDSKITFALEWNEKTLEVYPFKFRLEISHVLNENSVETIWTVKNFDKQKIYFSIGAHPALRCPIDPNETFEDCYLKFNAEEKSSRLLLSKDGLTHDRVPTIDGSTIDLNYDLFKGDALIFDDLKSTEITICSKKSSKSITLATKGFPFWGIWTPDRGGAPFLCIEPWQGHADFVDFDGDFKDKDGIVSLNVGDVFKTGYTFIINE